VLRVPLFRLSVRVFRPGDHRLPPSLLAQPCYAALAAPDIRDPTATLHSSTCTSLCTHRTTKTAAAAHDPATVRQHGLDRVVGHWTDTQYALRVFTCLHRPTSVQNTLVK
jgi:hypothetical protein